MPSNSRTHLYWPVETVESTQPNSPTADGLAEEDEDEGVIVCKEGKHNRWMTRVDAERAVRNDITGKTYILNDIASPLTSEAKEPVISKRPLENLKGDLKQVSHKRCRLGQANRNTIYFEAWARTSGDRDEHASSRYTTNGTTKLGVRKTVLKYRSGTLYNRKRAYWFKHADNSNCLLCGQQDGCHHTASGCPVLSRIYTHRHNALGRLILKAIMRGRQGGLRGDDGP